MQNDFAVGCSLEYWLVLQLLSQDPVVVDLAVDGQNQCVVGVGQWLCSTLYGIFLAIARQISFASTRTDADNAEALMAQNYKNVSVYRKN